MKLPPYVLPFWFADFYVMLPPKVEVLYFHETAVSACNILLDVYETSAT